MEDVFCDFGDVQVVVISLSQPDRTFVQEVRVAKFVPHESVQGCTVGNMVDVFGVLPTNSRARRRSRDACKITKVSCGLRDGQFSRATHVSQRRGARGCFFLFLRFRNEVTRMLWSFPQSGALQSGAFACPSGSAADGGERGGHATRAAHVRHGTPAMT